MRLIIAGSRDIPQAEALGYIEAWLQGEPVPDEIIGGGCKGPDRAGAAYAATHGIPYKLFRANWTNYGESAGPLRNGEMATYAAKGGDGYLLLIWDGGSMGSADMLRKAKRAKLRIIEKIVEPENERRREDRGSSIRNRKSRKPGG